MKIYKATTLIIYTKQEVEMEIGSRWLFLEEGKNKDIKLGRFGIGEPDEEVFVDKTVFKENFTLVEVGCDKCHDRMIDEVYEFEGKEFCFDCLMKELEVETEVITNYYIDNIYLGSISNIDGVIEHLNLSNANIKTLKVEADHE